MKPTKIYNQFDVVRVPFPFVDRSEVKWRPALVLSIAEMFNIPAGHSVMAMITSSIRHNWPLDYEVLDRVSAGLPVPSAVRFKLFTLDHRLIGSVLGRLGAEDSNATSRRLRELFWLPTSHGNAAPPHL